MNDHRRSWEDAERLEPPLAAMVSAVAAATCGMRDQLERCIERYFASTTNTEPLYEALLQTYLFAGFPAAIEALKCARRVANCKGIEFRIPAVEDYDVATFARRGEELCRTVYGNLYDRVRMQMRELSPHLDAWMIIEGYGKVLSRPVGLSTLERELCAAVALAAGNWQTQLYSHLRALRLLRASRTLVVEALRGAAATVGEQRIAPAFETLDRVWQ